MNTKEFLKQCGIWIWRVVEMIGELLSYIILILYEFWILTVIAVFLFLAWYLGLLT